MNTAHACRLLSLAMCLGCLLGVTACATATPESGVEYFKRRAGVDLTAYERDVAVFLGSANRFNEQPNLSSGKIRLALLSVYPPGTPKEKIFPKNEIQSILTYEAHQVWMGGGKYTSHVRDGATREFEAVVDSPQDKYLRLVENVIFLAPWLHQLSFDFSAENTLLDIAVHRSPGK